MLLIRKDSLILFLRLLYERAEIIWADRKNIAHLGKGRLLSLVFLALATDMVGDCPLLHSLYRWGLSN